MVIRPVNDVRKLVSKLDEWPPWFTAGQSTGQHTWSCTCVMFRLDTYNTALCSLSDGLILHLGRDKRRLNESVIKAVPVKKACIPHLGLIHFAQYTHYMYLYVHILCVHGQVEITAVLIYCLIAPHRLDENAGEWLKAFWFWRFVLWDGSVADHSVANDIIPSAICLVWSNQISVWSEWCYLYVFTYTHYWIGYKKVNMLAKSLWTVYPWRLFDQRWSLWC